MTSQQPVSRSTKSQPQRVVDSIQERIFSGALQAGDRIPPEPDLMRELGVSRTVVREALSSLQASGLVKTRHGIGTFVLERPAHPPLMARPPADLHVKQKLAMLELRISLESEAAHLAALRRNETQLQTMRSALDDYRTHWTAGNSTVEDDYKFHAQIAAATDNPYFQEVISTLGSATLQSLGAPSVARPPTTFVGQFGAPLPMLSDGKDIALREHEAIYVAIARQDAVTARAAMLMHLSNSRERLRQKISQL